MIPPECNLAADHTVTLPDPFFSAPRADAPLLQQFDLRLQGGIGDGDGTLAVADGDAARVGLNAIEPVAIHQGQQHLLPRLQDGFLPLQQFALLADAFDQGGDLGVGIGDDHCLQG